MPAKPTTVDEYLAALPAERRNAIEAVEDVPLDVIGEAVARVPVAQYLMRYASARPRGKKKA